MCTLTIYIYIYTSTTVDERYAFMTTVQQCTRFSRVEHVLDMILNRFREQTAASFANCKYVYRIVHTNIQATDRKKHQDIVIFPGVPCLFHDNVHKSSVDYVVWQTMKLAHVYNNEIEILFWLLVW
jgi:hypothetical protein